MVPIWKKMNEEEKQNYRDYQKEWRFKNRERLRLKSREKLRRLSPEEKERRHERRREFYWKNRDEIRKKERVRERRTLRNLRITVLNHYGNNNPKCVCCGENNIEFLTIDHIHGKGREMERRLKESGWILYKWLIKMNYPKGFQILCYNCNCSRGHYGYCPHTKNTKTLINLRQKYLQGEKVETRAKNP